MPLQPIKELEAGLAHAVNFSLNPISLSRQIEQVRQTANHKRKRIRRASLRNKLRADLAHEPMVVEAPLERPIHKDQLVL
jgi:hypothetical protein